MNCKQGSSSVHEEKTPRDAQFSGEFHLSSFFLEFQASSWERRDTFSLPCANSTLPPPHFTHSFSFLFWSFYGPSSFVGEVQSLPSFFLHFKAASTLTTSLCRPSSMQFCGLIRDFMHPCDRRAFLRFLCGSLFLKHTSLKNFSNTNKNIFNRKLHISGYTDMFMDSLKVWSLPYVCNINKKMKMGTTKKSCRLKDAFQ